VTDVPPNAPVVSWLLPVKNGLPYLTETLASIAAQTFQDFELLVWLVPGTDGTRAELEHWIPLRIPGRIVGEGPLGVGASLHRLVAASEAEFCARIDADDICEPDRLARQVAYLRTHPEIALVGSRMRLIGTDGRPTGGFHECPPDHVDIVNQFLVNNVVGHPSVIFRRVAVVAAGNYADTPVEDYDLWLRLACTHRLAALPDPVVRYRVHQQSLTQLNTVAVVSVRAIKTLSAHSSALFGLSAVDVAALHARERRFVLRYAVRTARHLAQHGNLGFWTHLRRPSLIDMFRFFRRPYDLVSLFALALLDRRQGALPGAFASLGALLSGGLRRRFARRTVPAAPAK